MSDADGLSGNSLSEDPVFHLCSSESMPASAVPVEAGRKIEVKPRSVTHANI